jgi:acetate kinase
VLQRVGAARVQAVGHRVVHGGRVFGAPVRIDDAVLAQVTALSPLAPLHQPHNVAGIQAARQAFPGVPQIACFDTAFHRGMPELNQRFALPQALFDAGVQRYGFHGLSYESICAQLQASEPTLARGRIVIAHLGNGASLCAVKAGQSVATTMGFSPLDGLPMGTRCGRLDAAVVLYLLQQQNHTTEAVSHLLHHESGLLGLSGISSDMRELQASDAPAAKLAVDYFVAHIQREVAALAASLQGLDALVFTGGIGENASSLRTQVIDGLAWMGVGEGAQSPVQVRVMRTHEEGVIARHTASLLRAG